MEEKNYRKPNYFHYLANKLIFGDRNSVTGDTFRIYTYEPHREGLEVQELIKSEKIRFLDLINLGSLKTKKIEGNGIAKVLGLYFNTKDNRYRVYDTIFSDIKFDRYDENFEKTSRNAIVAVSMLIEALETRSFYNIPMIMNDLPEITKLLMLYKEEWAKD